MENREGKHTGLAEPGAGQSSVRHEGDGDEGFQQPHDEDCGG